MWDYSVLDSTRNNKGSLPSLQAPAEALQRPAVVKAEMRLAVRTGTWLPTWPQARGERCACVP